MLKKDKQGMERLYKKSIEVLKSVQMGNGGCLATPEGERYPYVYPRDHGMCMLAFLSAGLKERVRKGLEFVFSAQIESGAFPQRYDKNGQDASYKPVQLDGTALTIYSFSKYVNETNDLSLLKDYWESIEKAAQYIKGNFNEEKSLVYTPNSIHEFPPMENGLEIWSNSACYGALMELSYLAKKTGKEWKAWQLLGNNIRNGILKNLWNTRLQSFVKCIRLKESSSVVVDPDASSYGVAEFGVLDNGNKMIKNNVNRIEKRLWNKDLGGICRYPKYEGRNNGGWGPWPHFTLMLCRHFIKIKDRKKAEQYLKWVLRISYKNLLPEHLSTKSEFEEYVTDYREAGLLRKDRMIMIENTRKHPMFKKGLAYITLPLAWPHAEFIRTWNLYKGVWD